MADTNKLNYPLHGGISPSDPSFPNDRNPEIKRLNQLLAEKDVIIAQKDSEINVLKTQTQLLSQKIEMLKESYDAIKEMANSIIAKNKPTLIPTQTSTVPPITPEGITPDKQSYSYSIPDPILGHPIKDKEGNLIRNG